MFRLNCVNGKCTYAMKICFSILFQFFFVQNFFCIPFFLQCSTFFLFLVVISLYPQHFSVCSISTNSETLPHFYYSHHHTLFHFIHIMCAFSTQNVTYIFKKSACMQYSIVWGAVHSTNIESERVYASKRFFL